METEKLNGVWELAFSMPVDDPKLTHCTPFQLVRWGENGAFYRLLDRDDDQVGGGLLADFSAEHVAATLIDDVIFGTLQLDNLPTRTVLERLLSLQRTKNWVLGDCDFTRYFSYNWSNENLLAALFSVPNRFDEDYVWRYDTGVYPWRIHLKRLDPNIDPQLYAREGRGIQALRRTTRARDVCTRLYALGYGEGVNQLTFAAVNGGVPYIDAAPELIQKYGLITRIWEDLRFENPQSLLDRARVLLEGYARPRECFDLTLADLEKLTGSAIDRPEAGKLAWIEGERAFITQVERHLDEVGQDRLELANAPQDLAGSIAELADRQRINSVYAQGATCLYSQSFNDNADAGFPATIRFYVPAEARQINKVILTWQLERFRAYQTGAEYAGATTRTTTEGGATTRTTTEGGATTRTTTEGGATTRTTTEGGSSTPTTAEGGRSTQTSTSGGGGTESSTSGGGGYYTTSMQDEWGGYDVTTSSQETGHAMRIDPSKLTSQDHYHSLYVDETQPHSHTVSISSHSHRVTFSSHSHSVTVPAHTHTVTIRAHSHSVTIPAHTHSVTIPAHSHQVTIPAHTHQVSIPAHTHAIIYGIYEGPRATGVTLKVDGRAVPLGSGQTEIDIVNYLSVESGSGKIRRGTFHTIEIHPDSLTRITATLSVQLFIQSEGGGLY